MCLSGVIAFISRPALARGRTRCGPWWRRAVAWIAVGCGVILWFWFTLHIWDGLTGYFYVKPPPDDPNPGLTHNGTNVLILSSSGRSGSSFLGDLLSSFDDTFYFFEPMRLVKPDFNIKQQTIEELRRAFSCNLRDDLFSTFHGSSTVYYSTDKGCQSGIGLKYKVERARHKCRTFPMMVVKTIRARLEWIMSLMDDKELGLRVIHLVRDPRPVRMSLRRLSFGGEYTAAACDNMLKDMKFKEEMEKRYSARYLFIRYEDLVVNLHNKTLDIYKFLSGAAAGPSRSPPDDLPPCCRKFIADHTTSTNGGDYSTFRNTKKVVQQWRGVITQQELTETENLCEETLRLLGYTIFTTVEAARNASIPLLSKGTRDILT